MTFRNIKNIKQAVSLRVLIQLTNTCLLFALSANYLASQQLQQPLNLDKPA